MTTWSPPGCYEYLSTGKPVVSMLWPDQVEIFPDVVYGAHSEREFLTFCQHALEEAPDFATQRRRNHAQAAAWPNRAVPRWSGFLATAGLLAVELSFPPFWYSRGQLFSRSTFPVMALICSSLRNSPPPLAKSADFSLK